MKDVSKLTFRVVDSESALFFPIAQRLARDAKLVEYWTPAWEAMPTIARSALGDGFENIQRIDYPMSDFEPDTIMVFPDIDFAKMQADAVDRGLPVWGNRDAEDLENSRGKFLMKLLELELPVPKYQKIVGIKKLEEHLRKTEDVYIKVSRYRGDWETLHWRSWDLDKTEFYLRAVRLGPAGDYISFYVFDPIDAVIEDGVDTWSVDGKYPSLVLRGVERKNQGYFGTVMPFKDLPESLREINEAFAPVLGSYGARGFFSTEVRITEDGTNYFIDPTIRAPSPPSQICSEMFSNYPEIVAAGAHGDIAEPVPEFNFGAQILLRRTGDTRVWSEIEIPEKLKQWVKLSGCAQFGKKACSPPVLDGKDDIGWLCAAGDTIEEVVENMKNHISELPEGCSADTNAIADLLKEISNAEEQGIEFTNKQEIPGPEIAV